MTNKIVITDRILSIPPFISTTWSCIATLHMKGGVIAITLKDGDTLNIPNLEAEIIQSIFQHHAIYLENEQSVPAISDVSRLQEIMGQPGEPSIRFAFGTSIDGLGGVMQHNPDQKNAPDLPQEILQKIGTIAKIMGSSEDLELPQAEANCNCFHCQITRALNSGAHVSEAAHLEEADVSDSELQFQQWSIQQTADKLFTVINRLDEHEQYQVYLGEPVGCTCGRTGCEHILAVLKS